MTTADFLSLGLWLKTGPGRAKVLLSRPEGPSPYGLSRPYLGFPKAGGHCAGPLGSHMGYLFFLSCHLLQTVSQNYPPLTSNQLQQFLVYFFCRN